MSSEHFGHQNGHQRVTTGRHRTGRIDTCGRFSQYKSTLVRTEQNGSGRPSTNFECGAFNLQMPGRTRVKSRGPRSAFNAGPLPTGLSGRQRRAIDRTTPSCDKNDARRTGCSEVFRCGARVIRTRAAVGGSWPPSRRAFYPRSPKALSAPELCKAVSVSRQIASHWHKPIVTKARPPRPPGARTRATRVRSSSGPCARTRDEIERPVSPLASHRLGWTCPTALPPASRAGRAPKLPLEQADERHATAGSLVR